MNKRGICKKCNQEKSIRGKGFCTTCYRKQEEKQICKNCGKLKQIEGRGLCGSCWVKLKNNGELNNYELEDVCTNEYKIINDIVFLKIINTNDEEFYTCFNILYLELVKKYKWYISDLGYVVSSSLKYLENKTLRLHRLITNVSDEYIVDHKEDYLDNDLFIPKQRNNLDNNLRITNQMENSWNTNIGSSNKSGVIGVSWNSAYNKWRTLLKCNGKNVLYKDFKLKEDAIVARLKAEKEYFGEYAPQKHLFEEYNIT